MFPFSAPEPKVLQVKGDAIRTKIREYIAQGEESLKGYEAARGIRLKGDHTWERHVRSVQHEVNYMKVILDSVGEGPHTMSVTEFETLWAHFNPWKTADEVIAQDAKEAAGESS